MSINGPKCLVFTRWRAEEAISYWLVARLNDLIRAQHPAPPPPLWPPIQSPAPMASRALPGDMCCVHPASHHRGYTQIKLSSCLVCVRRGLCCCWLMGPLSALVFIEPKVNEGQSGDTRAASQEPWERRHVWWDQCITYQCCTSALLSGDTRPTQRAQAHGWVVNTNECRDLSC